MTLSLRSPRITNGEKSLHDVILRLVYADGRVVMQTPQRGFVPSELYVVPEKSAVVGSASLLGSGTYDVKYTVRTFQLQRDDGVAAMRHDLYDALVYTYREVASQHEIRTKTVTEPVNPEWGEYGP